MSNSDFTKFMIARGLKQLLETKSFTDVTVGDIARHCKMSRNTFYYHFKDKYDVINWIFYTEITPLIGDTVSIDKWGAACVLFAITYRRTRPFTPMWFGSRDKTVCPTASWSFMRTWCKTSFSMPEEKTCCGPSRSK